jgi:Protein of unknown function (DUF3089)
METALPGPPDYAAVHNGECLLARKFLYLIAILIMLAIAAAFAYRLFGPQMMRAVMVPSVEFRSLPPVAGNAYAERDMWLARPDIAAGNPALWLPDGVAPVTQAEAAVFFIHPTSFLERSAWNAPLDDREANDRAALFLRGQASAFNATGEIWAPRYRQAAFGAFLTDKPEATQALALAYRDVATAFDQFIADVAPERPIILAGHSQGALHLTRLLREKVAGTPIARRVVAAYVVGWPVSRETDLAALGLPECSKPDQPGCLLSWQSFAEPADPSLVLDNFEASTGFDGKPRRGTAMVCTNPLTGALVPADDLKSAALTVGAVPARCDPRGVLLIGDPPELGPYVLPGNNYHVYDYGLFWANIRADTARRLAAWKAQ